MTRRLSAAAAAAVFVVGTCIVGSAPAAYADDRIGLSLDRVSWTDDITTGLFDPELRWVPGDRRTETFYVRNQSGETADLTVLIQGTSSDDLMQTGDLSVTARAAGGRTTPVDSPGTRPLLHVPALRAGQVESVDVTVALRRGATNRSETESLDLAFDVRLTQARGSEPTSDDSLLPSTGGVRLTLLMLAVALIGLGAAVLRRPRQESDDD